MPLSHPRFKAAACHISSVFLDIAGTVEKGISFIREAAAKGAALIAFRRASCPAFRLWAGVARADRNHAFSEPSLCNPCDGRRGSSRLRRQPRTWSLCLRGISEGRTPASDASGIQTLIGPDGSILNHHRKLVPTFYEKLIWANGDARGLRVTPTEIGRIGALICGENTNPLSRYALMAEGEQVHVSTYPPLWPTRPPTDNNAYDLRRAIEIRAGAHAFEAKVFNIVSSAFADEALIAAVSKNDKDHPRDYRTIAQSVQ